jgi:hypothetical protein
MGYYTRYSLDIQKYDDTEYQKQKLEMNEKIQEILESDLSTDIANLAIDAIKEKYESKTRVPTKEEVIGHIGCDPFSDSCKWYEHTDDMIKISKKYPGVLFILSREGENSGDIWKEYFYNGMVQIAIATITFEPFDLKKLKTV